MTPENQPPGDATPERPRWMWAVPVLAFLVGLMLGGGIIALVRPADSAPAAGPPAAQDQSTQPATPGITPAPTATSFTVPAECVQVASDSQRILDLVEQAVAAARDLDASRLSDLVAELRTAQETVRAQANDCQQAVASPTPSVSS